MIDIVSNIVVYLIFIFAVINLIFGIKDLLINVNNNKDLTKIRVFSIIQIVLSSFVILGWLVIFLLLLIS